MTFLVSHFSWYANQIQTSLSNALHKCSEVKRQTFKVQNHGNSFGMINLAKKVTFISCFPHSQWGKQWPCATVTSQASCAASQTCSLWPYLSLSHHLLSSPQSSPQWSLLPPQRCLVSPQRCLLSPQRCHRQQWGEASGTFPPWHPLAWPAGVLSLIIM